MGRTSADKGGTVFSVADLNSAAVQFANLLLEDEEFERTVRKIRRRYARASKAPHKGVRKASSARSRSPANAGLFYSAFAPASQEIVRYLQLADRYESQVSRALEARGVRGAKWLPRLLLARPSSAFGGSPRGSFFKPEQVPAVRDIVADILSSTLPEIEQPLIPVLPKPFFDPVVGVEGASEHPPPALPLIMPSRTGNVSLELTYNPPEESRKRFEDRALDQIRPQLDDIEEQYRTRYGLRSKPRKRPELKKHVRWLYQRLVEERPWPEIARGARPQVDRSTVQDAARNLARAFRIELPPGKPGRPPKPRAKPKK